MTTPGRSDEIDYNKDVRPPVLPLLERIHWNVERRDLLIRLLNRSLEADKRMWERTRSRFTRQQQDLIDLIDPETDERT